MKDKLVFYGFFIMAFSFIFLFSSLISTQIANSQTAPFPPTNLGPGSTGASVRQLQEFLMDQGFGGRLTVADLNDETYGPKTIEAVKSLQDYLVSQNLMSYNQMGSGYGSWGPLTRAAYYESPYYTSLRTPYNPSTDITPLPEPFKLPDQTSPPPTFIPTQTTTTTNGGSAVNNPGVSTNTQTGSSISGDATALPTIGQYNATLASQTYQEIQYLRKHPTIKTVLDIQGHDLYSNELYNQKLPGQNLVGGIASTFGGSGDSSGGPGVIYPDKNLTDLNKNENYLAFRWDYNKTSPTTLRHKIAQIYTYNTSTKTLKNTGALACPVDWGPSMITTNRSVDVSPHVMAIAGGSGLTKLYFNLIDNYTNYCQTSIWLKGGSKYGPGSQPH